MDRRWTTAILLVSCHDLPPPLPAECVTCGSDSGDGTQQLAPVSDAGPNDGGGAQVFEDPDAEPQGRVPKDSGPPGRIVSPLVNESADSGGGQSGQDAASRADASGDPPPAVTEFGSCSKGAECVSDQCAGFCLVSCSKDTDCPAAANGLAAICAPNISNGQVLLTEMVCYPKCSGEADCSAYSGLRCDLWGVLGGAAERVCRTP